MILRNQYLAQPRLQSLHAISIGFDEIELFTSDDERIVKKTSREIKSLDFGWFSLFSLSTQLRLSFESVTGDTAGAWVTVMGEVIT